MTVLDKRETMTRVKAIRTYFFGKDEPAQQIIKEIKALTEEDKTELAQGAAEQLNVRLDDGTH